MKNIKKVLIFATELILSKMLIGREKKQKWLHPKI